MTLFRFLDPVFRALNDGKFIRITVALAIRVLSVILGLAGIVWCVGFIVLGVEGANSVFASHSSALVIGAITFGIFGLAFGLLACGVCLFRARSVMALVDGSFTVLPVLSILFRLAGELTFTLYSLIGVGGCLVLWIADLNPLAILSRFAPGMPSAPLGTGGVIGGIEFAVFMLLSAFIAFVVFYALAEFTVVAVEIANNTRNLAIPSGVSISSLESAIPLKMDAMLSGNEKAHTSQNSAQKCSACSQPLDPGAGFCAECGQPVGKI